MELLETKNCVCKDLGSTSKFKTVRIVNEDCPVHNNQEEIQRCTPGHEKQCFNSEKDNCKCRCGGEYHGKWWYGMI